MTVSQASIRQRLWHNLAENPITIKELRGRMRGRRAFAVLTAYLTVVSLFVTFIYLTVALSADYTTTYNSVGQAIFFGIVFIQATLVIFIGPAFTSGAISGEKERQTYELLRTTLLSPASFVAGKLISALSYVFLLLLSSIPILSLAFMFGGVAFSELLISQLLLAASAITYAMLGLFFSSRARSSTAASVATYAVVFFFTLGTPVLAAMFLSFLSLTFLFNNPPTPITILLMYGGLIGASTNLPATMFISEIFLREYNAVWGIIENIDGINVWFFSPWYVFILVHLIASFILYRLTIRSVARIATE
jgi:ABC-2 type transport system permease protein